MIRNSVRVLTLLLVLVVIFSCNRKKKEEKIAESRTSGNTTILIDESFSNILDDQIEVFVDDYPNAHVKAIAGNEAKIMPLLLNREENMIILSRMLNSAEERYFRQKQIPVYTDRFAIDGIALITNASNTDTLITAKEVFEVLKGENTTKKLVFDNAASSTVRYFLDSAGVKTLPSTGVYTLTNNNEVINYIAAHTDYIGVVGINWVIANKPEMDEALSKIKVMSVKGLQGKKGGDNYYKPTQNNLINARYPFLRNIYIINCEAKNGLGTGFANWLNSPRGQLIVLKAGLGPHKMISRDFNIK